jgi:eukaryotic-like serine/threonine-protein kinase
VWAVPFDAQSASVRGATVTVIPSGVMGNSNFGGLALQLSSTGTLVFVPSGFYSQRVVSVGRDGSELSLNLPLNRYGNPRISPDGRQLLIENGMTTIETLDLARGTRARLAPAAPGTGFPNWTADGKRVVFRRFNVPVWAAADGSGNTGLLPAGLANDFPCSPGADSDSVIGVRLRPETAGDIYQLSISGKFSPRPLLATPAYEGGPQLSPDRHWLLYQSNESGQWEIYVRQYPAMDREWQVSDGGGVQGAWSGTGREIFYRSGQHMMAVVLNASSSEPTFGKPQSLFADEYDFFQNVSIPNYAVTHDGRFIMLRRIHNGSLRVVIKWTEELKKILAEGGTR